MHAPAAPRLCTIAFQELVGGTPITYEWREGRWVAIAGRYGLTEITKDTFAAVRAEVNALYRHDRQSAAQNG